ncbi:uncharacterized protein LY89DRAFT_761184 [Mollisia scopiformis]|uniref:Uncharacterized protein n=1 Tax=Mollisia scopiformis TaxID=149040 RepID=A0A132BAY3_MOLSC|nr:uncharacterized protein LY89DRAFT_761184 [Mollisia scopiformis]KUJ09575.1 hypothetical protein LY89DRAFT_761184 [Mollisia scopiformis]
MDPVIVTVETKAKAAQETCRFLIMLPPEVRDMIYRYLLVKDTPIRITPLPHIPISRPRTFHSAILRTNKKIYEEARSIFYSANLFVVGNGDTYTRNVPNLEGLKVFIKRVPKSCLPMIKNIELEMRLKPLYPTLTLPEFGNGYIMSSLSEDKFTTICAILKAYFHGFSTLRIMSCVRGGLSISNGVILTSAQSRGHMKKGVDLLREWGPEPAEDSDCIDFTFLEDLRLTKQQVESFLDAMADKEALQKY